MSHFSERQPMADLPFLLRFARRPGGPPCTSASSVASARWERTFGTLSKPTVFRFPPSNARLLEDIFSSRDERSLRAQWGAPARGRRRGALFGKSVCWRWAAGRSVRPKPRVPEICWTIWRAGFLALEPCPDAVALATFLFDERGLRGAAPADYYNPLNSNLTHVLQSGAGLPITLASIFILVGAARRFCRSRAAIFPVIFWRATGGAARFSIRSTAGACCRRAKSPLCKKPRPPR